MGVVRFTCQSLDAKVHEGATLEHHVLAPDVHLHTTLQDKHEVVGGLATIVLKAQKTKLINFPRHREVNPICKSSQSKLLKFGDNIIIALSSKYYFRQTKIASIESLT